MSTAAEYIAATAIEVVIFGVAAGLLYRLWGRFLPFPRRINVPMYYRTLVLRGQQIRKVLEPGTYWVSSKDVLASYDMRPRPFMVPVSDLLAANGGAVRVSLVGEYRIVDAMLFSRESSDAFGSLHLEIQRATPIAVSEFDREPIVSGKAPLASRVREISEPRVAYLGIAIDRIEVQQAVPLG